MKKSELDLLNLKNCIEALEECVVAYKTNTNEQIRGFIEDSCVKRFEFTVETSWKTMKKYLKEVYGKEDKELTMNNIFRLSEGYGIIKSWEVWREYYDRRNDTSHEYNREKAIKILEIINNLLEDAEFLYNELEKEINK
jgi:nucleotidyltransferase substrate binding protein (TIGR01987 family)